MGGIAADTSTIARWAYELYGARLLPLPAVKAMVTPLSDDDIFPNIKYGLGTECFHVAFGTDDSFGHGGNQPSYTTLFAVIPARHLAAAVFIADDNKDTFAIMKGILDQMR